MSDHWFEKRIKALADEQARELLAKVYDDACEELRLNLYGQVDKLTLSILDQYSIVDDGRHITITVSKV